MINKRVLEHSTKDSNQARMIHFIDTNALQTPFYNLSP